ncbi:MAG: hypothetical protein RL095_1310 [Verrucomicrobiota bacterium]
MKILLLPGWTQTCSQLKQLLPEGFEIIETDWQYASSPSSLPRPDLVNPQEPFVVLGHSLGACLGLKMMAHPLCRGAILLGAFACFAPEETALGKIRGRNVRSMLRRLALDFTAAKPLVAEFLVEADKPGEKLLGRPRGTPYFVMLSHGLELLLELDLRPRLAGLAVPALVMHGDLDAVVPVSYGRELAGGLPRAQYREFPGTGHAFFRQEGKAVKHALAQFLKELNS